MTPGTTTEPVQSNDLNDNYLRRRDVYQVQPVREITAADRRNIEVDSEEDDVDPQDVVIDHRYISANPRDIFIDRLSSSSDRVEVLIDSQGHVIVEPRDDLIDRREISQDISIYRSDVSRERADSDSSQLRDITTKLRTWR